MDIAEVRSFALSSPIDPHQDRPFHGGTRRLLKRDVVLVVLETADGQQGFATAGASSSAMREYFEGNSQETSPTSSRGKSPTRSSGRQSRRSPTHTIGCGRRIFPRTS